MELIFIRHGQPAWSVDRISQADPSLTDIGHRQAELMAKHIANFDPPITEILVSPAIRAQQTAAPLASMTQLTPTTVPELIEIRMPDWSDQLEEDVLRIFAEARNRPPEEWWNGLPGGESFREFHERICGTIEAILAERGMAPDTEGRAHLWHISVPGQRLVIVGHGGTNSVALTRLLSVDPTPWEWERFFLGHCSIARVRAISLAGEHVFSLRSFNDREHLPPDLRTR